MQIWHILITLKAFALKPLNQIKINLAGLPSWLEVGITGHNFGRGTSKDHSTKVWLQLAQWFLRRRLTYIPSFSVKYFFQPIYTDYAN
jgi:hypothetical protein